MVAPAARLRIPVSRSRIMAAFVLSVAGAAAGAVFGPAGAIAGRIAGALVGNIIDRKFFGPGDQNVVGPRLADLDVMASTEGGPFPRVYGRAGLAGPGVGATQLEEMVSSSTASSSPGGKGHLLSGPKTTTTTYTYYGNF